MNTTAVTDITNAITAALGSGQTGVAANLANMLHWGAQGHINYKDKTITVAWEQANSGTAALLLSQPGWSIIPD
jgi:hypothetical protein